MPIPAGSYSADNGLDGQRRWTRCPAGRRSGVRHLAFDRGADFGARHYRKRSTTRRRQPQRVVLSMPSESALPPGRSRSRVSHLLAERPRRRELRLASRRWVACQGGRRLDEPRRERAELLDRHDVPVRHLVHDFLQERSDDGLHLIALHVEAMRGRGQRAAKRFPARGLGEAGQAHDGDSRTFGGSVQAAGRGE